MTLQRSLLFSGLAALFVAAIGVAIPLAATTLLLAFEFGFVADWLTFWRVAVDVWLIGHGVDVLFVFDEQTASRIGLAGGSFAPVTIAALGFSLLTFGLARSAGLRMRENTHPIFAAIFAWVVFSILALVLALSATHPYAGVSLWQATLLPGAVFGAGLLVSLLGSNSNFWMRVLPQNPKLSATLAAIVRLGLGGVLLVLLASALMLTVLLVRGYAEVIQLYELLQTEIVGGVVLTLAEIAFLPNLVVWGGAWIVGAGFTLGNGSWFSQTEMVIRQLPDLPIFAVLPENNVFGWFWLIIPVLSGFALSLVIYLPLRGHIQGRYYSVWFLCVAVAGGIFGGALFAAVAAFSAGSLGGGFLTNLGADFAQVGWMFAVELTAGATLGFGVAITVEALRSYGRKFKEPWDF